MRDRETAGTVVLKISAWKLRKRGRADHEPILKENPRIDNQKLWGSEVMDWKGVQNDTIKFCCQKLKICGNDDLVRERNVQVRSSESDHQNRARLLSNRQRMHSNSQGNVAVRKTVNHQRDGRENGMSFSRDVRLPQGRVRALRIGE